METTVSGSLVDWLDDLRSRPGLTRKARTVLQSLATHPRLASFGTVREIAEKADVSLGTVTRTAQALEYPGWPAFQTELRSRYLNSLSANGDRDDEEAHRESASYGSLARDRENLNTLIASLDVDQLERTARLISQSRRTFIVAEGSFSGVGQIFAHNAWLQGYDVRLLSDNSQIVNTIALAEPEDLVIVISFWRAYESSLQAVSACHANGVPVILITETVTRAFEEQCAECIRVPTESTVLSPSLVAAVSVTQGIIAELVDVDPDRSARMIERADKEWTRFNLVHHF